MKREWMGQGAGLAIAVAMISGGALAAPSPGPLATIKAFALAINKGDMAGAKATHLGGSISIIDEFAPHAWVGPTAYDDWLAAFAADSKANDDTDDVLTIGAPIRVQVEGSAAYAVVHATLDYKEHGKPMHEASIMTYALEKTADGWKIKAWAWGGHKPAPETPPPAKAK